MGLKRLEVSTALAPLPGHPLYHEEQMTRDPAQPDAWKFSGILPSLCLHHLDAIEPEPLHFAVALFMRAAHGQGGVPLQA